MDHWGNKYYHLKVYKERTNPNNPFNKEGVIRVKGGWVVRIKNTGNSKHICSFISLRKTKTKKEAQRIFEEYKQAS